MANSTSENNYAFKNLAASDDIECWLDHASPAKETNDYLYTFVTEDNTHLLHAL